MRPVAVAASPSRRVALLLWRARRLGALAIEPLPVVGQGDRDDPQPRPALPQGRRPGARRRRAARRRPGAGRRTAAPGARPDPDDPGPRRRPAHRPPGRGRSTHCSAPDAAAARHRPRPDHPGRPAGRARQRGTPPMSETPTPARRRPRPTPASGWPPYAPRWRRPSSARTPPCPGLLVALLCGGHVLMEGVPGVAEDAAGAHPRRRARRSTPGGCSSRPT